MTRCYVSRIAALIAVAVLANCAYDEYSIELTPHDDVMQRDLTVRGMGDEEDAAVPVEKLAAIAELYPPEAATDVEGGHAFAGEFTYAMPSDVGGAGEYVTFDTRMGRCSAYIERFRGDDSPAERVQAAFDAADELTDLLIGWLTQELGACEDFPKLRAFLDEDLRSDLKDLTVYLFLLESSSSAEWAEDDSDEQLEKEAHARMAQYFIERQYLLPAELPAAARRFQESVPHGDPVAALCPLIVNIVQRKADLQDEDILTALTGLLADSGTLEESIAGYIATTEAYQQRLAEWEQLQDESPKPNPMAVLVDKAQAILLWELDILGSNDLVKVALHDVATPLTTNGLWEEQVRTISWSNRLNSTSLPAICYAVWAEPNEDFQTAHFDKVILEGDDLRDYCLWRKSLTDQEAAEWDTMIDRSQPDDENSLAMLRAFRFSHEPAIDPDAPPDPEAPPTYARQAIGLIVGGITASEEK